MLAYSQRGNDMSVVVQLNIPSRHQVQAERHVALIESFSQHRRYGEDVFWLKENAELLNILECTSTSLSEEALVPHHPFYSNIEKRLAFFPQYYRFLLSICLDLEDLGLTGAKGEALAHWVAQQGLVEAELSDLQRSEARRLLARRGVTPKTRDDGLEDRLRAFVSRSETFALPNKKAAYELTHTVFYLSEYGRNDPGLGLEVSRSLEFAGTLAFLEQNADLLAEVCIAMLYVGREVPKIWQDWLTGHVHLFTVESGADVSARDDYHEYLVCNWLMAANGGSAFAKRFERDRISFTRPRTLGSPLRELSEQLFELGDERCPDWPKMQAMIDRNLSEASRGVLQLAEASCAEFDAFFASFSRAGAGILTPRVG